MYLMWWLIGHLLANQMFPQKGGILLLLGRITLRVVGIDTSIWIADQSAGTKLISTQFHQVFAS